MAMENHPELLQLTPEFRMVVHLAIENDDIAGGFIAHRLRAGLRKIDNGQPRVAQSDPTIRRGPRSRGIRTARSQSLQRAGKLWRIFSFANISNDSAHELLFFDVFKLLA